MKILVYPQSRFHLSLAVLIVSSVITLKSQTQADVKFDRLYSENIRYVKGLSQNWIYAILQDKYGYMWFGTWDGLNKYDGYNYTIYNVDDGLSDHTINCLLEDDEGFLWIGTGNGLNKFDRASQKFTQYTRLPGDAGNLFHQRVMSIIQAKDGTIWLGTGGGLIRFDKATETMTPYLSTGQPYYSPRSNYILHLCEDKSGILWIATTYGLVKFDPKTERATRYYQISGDSSGLSHNNIRYILQEHSGNFWIGTRFGLNYFDTSTQVIRQYYFDAGRENSLSDNWIRVIYEDRNGQIWIGTENGGLNLFDRETKAFIRFQNLLTDKNSLSNNKVYSICEDISGNLWVGTYNGVNKIDRYYNNFEHIRQTGDNELSLNNDIIWSFTEDDQDNMWIGTSAGINIRNKKTGKYSFLTHTDGNPQTPAGNEIRKILYTPESHCFWFAYWGAGMDKYDPETGTFTHFKNNPNASSISDDYVNDIIQDHSGMIWIATGKGLNRLNPQTFSFETFKHSANNHNCISNDIAISLCQDSKGNIWIGTDDGLNRFNTVTNEFTVFKHDTADRNSLGNNTVFKIYEDKTGKIWVGTSGGGLSRLDPDKGKFRSYTTSEGLPNNIVYGILEDNEGNIWVSTNLGISKLYVISERFVNYDVKDGIQSNEFNLGANYRSKSGDLYFGGMNGYNVFDPAKIKFNPGKPVIVISGFRKFNERQPDEYFDGDTIRLGHDENFFSIEISALDYTNPAKNKYRYMLEHVDKDWIRTDATNRLAEYKKVQPGTYIFKANGSNNDGIWNDKGITLTIIISPPWWNTLLFRIFVTLAIVFLAWILIYRRIRRIRIEHEVEKKLLEIEKQKFDLEQKALRLQMNPHFIFNSLNSIQSYILSHDAEKAVQYLGKFSQLMRLILTHSAHKLISLKDELLAITHYLDLEKLRFENKFDYTIHVDENIDEEFIEIPPMIVQPYIENAIIHGLLHKPTRGNITIDFRLRGSRIICTVTDDGIGREKSMELEQQSGIRKKSKGMLITKERLEILSRQSNDEFSVKIIDLKDEHGNSSGTKVEIVIFYSKEE
jgi:ligand-binding sensor domain-containing protein/two-component sensor histidine kinase